ncbi:MAG: hypothetical protein ABF297_01695, partial [Thiogranum sp.]
MLLKFRHDPLPEQIAVVTGIGVTGVLDPAQAVLARVADDSLTADFQASSLLSTASAETFAT